MRLLPHVLFLIGTVPTIGGIAILVILSPKPSRWRDHLMGLSRYLMLGGASFGAARVLSGWRPTWDVVLFMIGIGLAMTIHAREKHLLAIARECPEDDGQESGT